MFLIPLKKLFIVDIVIFKQEINLLESWLLYLANGGAELFDDIFLLGNKFI